MMPGDSQDVRLWRQTVGAPTMTLVETAEEPPSPERAEASPSLQPRRIDLPDGSAVEVRPVRPDDAPGLRALYEGLDPEDRHRRFFSAYFPPPEFYERMVHVGGRGGFGLVAVASSGTGSARIVGQADYNLLANGDGELGMAVAAGWRGWLGPYLLAALIEAASSRGVPNIEADVLVTNAAMLGLLRAHGSATMRHSDWTVCRVVIGTAGDTPTWPGPHTRPRVLVEAPGGRWSAEDAARQAGLDVIVCPGPTRRRRPCPALLDRSCPLAAAADAIVVHPEDAAVWDALLVAHRRLHRFVPVCLSFPGENVDDSLASVEDALRLDPGTRASEPGPARS